MTCVRTPITILTVVLLTAACSDDGGIYDEIESSMDEPTTSTGGIVATSTMPSSEGETDCGLTCGQDDSGEPGSCDPFEQDCGDGEKCMPYSVDGDQTWNGLRCVPVAPEPKQLGESCNAPQGPVGGEDDCDVGLMCWNVPPEGTEGTCTAMCTGSKSSPTCAASSTVCAVYNEGVLPLCLPTCDPLGQDCPAAQICIPQGGGSAFVCAIDASPDTGQYGDPCLAFNKCDPGLFCAASSAVPGCTETVGCCTDYCDLSVADPDAQCTGAVDGQACVPFSETPAPGYENLGACALP